MLEFLSFHKKQKEFQSIMEIATEVADEEPAALISLTRSLLRPLQSEHLMALTERSAHNAPDSIDGASFFFNITDHHIFNYLLASTPRITLNLSRDIVFSTPWHRRRYSEALACIGVGKMCGAWRQDANHRVSVLLPWGIGFVLGGNHSIASGIMAGEGSVDVIEAYNLNPLFDLMDSDGLYYRNKKTRKPLARVNDHRRAAVFEIGRLMRHHNVCAFKESIDIQDLHLVRG